MPGGGAVDWLAFRDGSNQFLKDAAADPLLNERVEKNPGWGLRHEDNPDKKPGRAPPTELT